MKLNFVQRAVLKHILDCFEEEVNYGPPYMGREAQEVINQLPCLRGEGGHRSILEVISELKELTSAVK